MKLTTLDRLGKAGDIALAIAAIGVVAMVIVPLPTALLDLLICVNISAAVVLLLVSLYVPGAARLSTFPAILLLTTLFRLALNVSSTRLILIQADAGSVIDAFGQFVVQGNYVVGAVVFAILTVVQFVVVARGAERVSEVAARFTLDALPGRQLAIDADLRSGATTLEEAQRRRAALQRESQLFGAMDGAMKFVKGDAVAAIIIIGINVVAGIVIGVVQLGMALPDAVQTYTLLTIGDGLVSQIPALLIATAAGIIVTRVAGDQAERPLGEEISRQIAGHPRALTIAAVLLVGLALVPGLPALPFAAAAMLVGGVARLARRFEASERGVAASRPRLAVPTFAPLELHVSESLSASIDRQRDRFVGLLRVMREEIATDLGVEVPMPRIRMRDPGPGRFSICVDEVPIFEGTADGDATEQLDRLVEQAGAVLSRHAAQFVDMQFVQTMLDRLAHDAPVVVSSVVPDVVSIHQLTEVLRRLVAEQVSIRNLNGILDAIAALGPGPHATDAVVDLVRERLGRYLMHRFADLNGTLRYYELDRELEAMLVGSVRTSASRTYLALGPKLSREITESIMAQLDEARRSRRRAVLVTEQLARAHLFRLLRPELPNVVVLARQELVAGVDATRVGWIVAA